MSIAEEHTSFTYLFVGGKETQTLTSSVVGLDCDRVGFSGRLGLVSENPLLSSGVILLVDPDSGSLVRLVSLQVEHVACLNVLDEIGSVWYWAAAHDVGCER